MEYKENEGSDICAKTSNYGFGTPRRVPVSSLGATSAKNIEREGDITEEMAYLEKNLAALHNAVENLQIKTVKICRPEYEKGEDGEAIQGRNSEIGEKLQERNMYLRRLTSLIQSVTERIEL